MSQVTSHKSPELIVALDVDTLERAEGLVDKLHTRVKLFKIGSQLFTAYGPEAVRKIGAKGVKVFLDLKFYDIPQTVYGSSSTASSICIESSRIPTGIEPRIEETVQPAVFMLTVHTQGGKDMLEAAVKGARDKSEELKISKPFVVGVTVLTSTSKTEGTINEVLKRAKLAKEAGLDGVVCSVQEALEVRKACGEDFIIVTPGIRPQGAEKNDQKRCATPQEAVKAGANFIVIGRPILEAKDPLLAVKEILDSIKPER